jgi:dTDP-glucose 4,6-dehydratase
LPLGNILVTGGLGFIGSHFIHQILPKELGASSIINVDFEGYGSNSNNLKGLSDTRYRYVNTNINDSSILEALAKSTEINMIVNFAAETHVDRSISKPTQFVDSNINGVISLLELCRKHDIQLFIQISTWAS